jgi:putative ABC transport system substrate-binding protein
MAIVFSTTAAAQSSLPVIGFVNNGSSQPYERLVEAFRSGLAEVGYQSGKNVSIEYRWAEGHNERLPDLLQNLEQRRVAVIVATGGSPTALAAKKVSSTIPIVFSIGADPVKLGLVASLNRPGGNMTGVSFLANSLLAKQVEILHQIAATDAAIGFLVNPSNPSSVASTESVSTAAKTLGRQLIIAKASTPSEIEGAFVTIAKDKVGGLLIFPDSFFSSERQLLLRLVGQQRLPALYNREFALAGGLISYGARQSDAYKQAGLYAGRVLKGEKPADLPVVQSTDIELIINLKTAKSFGINVPVALLGRADEVIE